jgi:hypothetical protein
MQVALFSLRWHQFSYDHPFDFLRNGLSEKLRTGKLEKNTSGTIEYQSEEFRKSPLFIDDTPFVYFRFTG